jgi:hypothetical protein
MTIEAERSLDGGVAMNTAVRREKRWFERTRFDLENFNFAMAGLAMAGGAFGAAIVYLMLG